jgi:hypothetical protein
MNAGKDSQHTRKRRGVKLNTQNGKWQVNKSMRRGKEKTYESFNIEVPS